MKPWIESSGDWGPRGRPSPPAHLQMVLLLNTRAHLKKLHHNVFAFPQVGHLPPAQAAPPATRALSRCPARLPSAASYPSPHPAQQLEAGAKGSAGRATSPRDTGLEHEMSK